VAAILKIAVETEEEVGNGLMVWWDGQGVPLVLAREGKAILLERAQKEGSLADLADLGRLGQVAQAK
jgi:streptomycin 6-kinase